MATISSIATTTSWDPFLMLKAKYQGSIVFWLKVMQQILVRREKEHCPPSSIKLRISSAYLKTYSEVTTLLGVHIFPCQPL